ncbi:MAG: methionyl-tRNA formyltransferase [Gemmatimonadota bacterium]|nr:methionyl-tRNA formyltransferase [Gemmatimonadota bacterium]MDH3426947.1 methionyl-tRNA formyltransferase [Gemmatimonadota bacterium]
MKVLFWGTPEFAVPSLRALQEEGHIVVAVVTQPDRPAGRGRAVRPSPVKREANEEGIPVLQPEDPNDPRFVASLRLLGAEISVVVAYGRILSEDVLNVPERGSVNVHASLLPKLRGAGPVHWAIIRGHPNTGVTIMRIVPELDSGPILYTVETRFPDDITAGELAERLAEVGATALVEALAQMEAGSLPEKDQDHDRATYAPKLSRETARLDWSLDAKQLGRWIRGCDPSPAAWTTLNGSPVQLFGPTPGDEPTHAEPGTVVRADPRSGLAVATGRGTLDIAEVRPEGRPRMTSRAWISGRAVAAGDRFV